MTEPASLREKLQSAARSLRDAGLRLIRGNKPPSLPSKTYRYLARQIDLDMPVGDGERGRALVFSSVVDSEVSNETLLMMAHYLNAELHCRVLVVDGTLRRTGISDFLELDPEPGFNDLLASRKPIAVSDIKAVQRNELFVLGRGITDEAEVPAISPSVAESFWAAVRESYDYVILQQGPIDEDTRYFPFCVASDTVFLHIRERATSLAELDQCESIFFDQQVGNVKYLLTEA